MSEKTKVDYVTATWNPCGWGCLGPLSNPGLNPLPMPCFYCYAKRAFADRRLSKCQLCNDFVPHWHPERLEAVKKWRTPQRVLVQSMGDLFGDWVPQEQIKAVLFVIEEHPQHDFLLLTKNPARYAEFEFPNNAWLGTTVEGEPSAGRLSVLCDLPIASYRWLSIEPFLDPLDIGPYAPALSWLVMGAQTGPGAKRCERDWVEKVMDAAKWWSIPVFMKKSMAAVVPKLTVEYPRALQVGGRR